MDFANRSVKANLNLLKRRDHLFDRTPKQCKQPDFPVREPVPLQVRDRFRAKLRAERHAERQQWGLSVVLAFGLLLLVWLVVSFWL